jgi:hypothetical protein
MPPFPNPVDVTAAKYRSGAGCDVTFVTPGDKKTRSRRSALHLWTPAFAGMTCAAFAAQVN